MIVTTNVEIPDDAIVEGSIAVVLYMDDQGRKQCRVGLDSSEHVAGALGMLDMAKLDVLVRSRTVVGGQAFYGDDA